MKLNFKGKKGFTLPELLIVMTVLAALASVVLVTYPASRRKARDAVRRSDIKEYQTTIEVYYNKENKYPTAVGISALCTTLGMTDCPDDPRASDEGIHYGVNSSDSAYRVWAQLEYPPSPTTYFFSCSTGNSGEATSDPSSTDPC